MTRKRERVHTHDGRYCSWAACGSCEQRRVLLEAVMWSHGLVSEVKWATRKGRTGHKNNSRLLAVARPGHAVMLGAAIHQTASSVFFGPRPALVLTWADSQLQWITARGFYWSSAIMTVSSEGPNQTHESCCSFSFTRHTSRRLPSEVKRALLWQCHAFRSLPSFSLSGKRNFSQFVFPA